MNTNNPSRSAGQNVDTVDQLSSVKLLGLAIVGGILTLLANWIVFG